MQRTLRLTVFAVLLAFASSSARGVELQGEILDAATGKPLAARIYLQGEDGTFHFAKSTVKEGSAVEYNKARDKSIERHTALSAHPFVTELPAGKYKFTVERGKEYLSHEQALEFGDKSVKVTVKLKRFFDLAKLNWYSGETHVHRPLAELPTAMLADDLNVALPLTYWVTKSDTPPTQGDKNAPAVKAELIKVDDTHVIYPMNTEYEIFTVGGKSHTLGAIFALGHQTVFDKGVPPVREIALQTHREGGLLELDKHNWPWSMMLVPVMEVDLYELTNNHLWRTEFMFKKFGEEPADYMNIERDAAGFTEKGWIDFTFANYYALLNCGFRLRPTGGTATGVHPVPLGFGRVYVHLPDGFSYEAWMKGLNAGRSFVTTGPLLLSSVIVAPRASSVRGGREPDPAKVENSNTFKLGAGRKGDFLVWSRAVSARPLSRLEIVSAGEVLRSIKPANEPLEGGGFENAVSEVVSLDKSTWLAVRCYEPQADGRLRFAHSAPTHIDIEGKPLHPRPEEIQYLIRRVEAELARHAGTLPEAALDEYRTALAKYQAIAKAAAGRPAK